MTVELLPCSKCRRVPEWHTLPRRGPGDVVAWPMLVCPACNPGGQYMGVTQPTREGCVSAWNRAYGSPLTLAERQQDVPACDSHRERAKVWDATLREWVPQSSVPMTVGVFTGVRGPITTEYGDEPSVGDGVRVVPSAASCVERWRSCADGSVGACSGGVR